MRTFLRRGAAALVAALLTVTLAPRPAAAEIGVIGTVHRDSGGYEPRFPDVLALADGRLMAVWHRAKLHVGDPGTIMLSTFNGTRWEPPAPALARPGVLGDGVDMRDPKLARMGDDQVIMTFFAQGRVYHSVWRPGWTRFTDPLPLTAPDLSATGLASHGSVVPLAGTADQVLVPVYAGGPTGGAYVLRATYRPNSTPRLVPTSSRRIIANDDPPGYRYTEPNVVQIGDRIVAAVRAEEFFTPPLPDRAGGHARPLIIARWDAHDDGTPITTEPFLLGPDQPVLASSHHLLKTAAGKILLTYGNRTGHLVRPTYGMLIDDPLGPWTGTPRLLYDSGHYDQANPSTVEPAAGWFWTLAFDANPASPDNGRLLIVRSRTGDYAPPAAARLR